MNPLVKGRRRRRLVRVANRLLLLGVLVLVVVAVLLVQTGPGQRMLLDGVVSRVRGSLTGELAIGHVRSGTLLTGATLTDVAIDAGEGRPFLRADSVEMHYSPWALFTGRPRLHSIIVWGLDLEISRYGSEKDFNVLAAFRRRAAAESDSIGTGLEPGDPPGIDFGRIAVRGGVVRLLTPTARAGTAAPTVPSPDGNGRLRSLVFGNLDLDLEDAVVTLDDPDRLFTARVASFASEIMMLQRPLVLDQAFGAVTVGRSGITISDAAFRMPSTLLRGDLRVGSTRDGGPWRLSTTLETDGDGDLADLSWVDSRIPAGTFAGGLRVTTDDGIGVHLDSMTVEVDASTLTFAGGVRFGDEFRLESLDVTASPLALSTLEPWLESDLPLDGWLTGRVAFNGTSLDLDTSGRMTLVPTGHGGPSTADFSGIIHRGANPGATAFRARVAPLDYALLDVFLPDLPLTGSGEVALDLSGRAEQGLRITVEATHRADGQPDSRVLARGGLVRGERGDWIADITGELEPFAVSLLGGALPDLQLGGVLAGPFSAVGRLRDLQVTGDFAAEEGRLGLDGVIDARRLGSFYRLDVAGDGLSLSHLSARFPQPSQWSGLLSIEGRGLAPDSMDATATLFWSRSRIGGLHIDTVSARLSAAAGILTVDSLEAILGKVHVSGDGRLGIVAPLDGAATLAFATDSLGGLRPLLLGDSVMAKDTLSALERDFLRLQGVDVDALPDTSDVRMHGSMSGTVRLVGSVDALDVDLDLDVRKAVYGQNRVDSASVKVTADALPGFMGAWDVLLDAYGVSWQSRDFQFAHVDGSMLRQEGEATLSVERGVGERLDAAGSFALDSLGATLDVAEAALTIDSLDYLLAHSTRLVWTEKSLAIEELEVVRGGDDPMTLQASGSLSREDISDFSLDVRGLHLDRLMRIAELEGADLAGHVDLSLRVNGLADAPAITGSFMVEEARVDDLTLSRVAGEIAYSGLDVGFRLGAWEGPRLVFDADGTIPYDLSLAQMDDRSVRRPMDIRITADSLDAAVPLSYIALLEDVEGVVSVDVRVRGTTEAPEPDGVIELERGAWSIDVLGVRHTGVGGTLRVNPDRTVDVALSTEGSGSSSVSGRVAFAPLRDPVLQLDISFSDFQAVDRLDIEGRISGDVELKGRYGRPVVEGDLTVDGGTLFVDEFARSATVVDLLDPRLFGADTTAFVTQPLLRGLRNPFLENLYVNITLDVPRDTWLRSDDMDVEIGGEDLTMLYDRLAGDIVVLGELQALRGSYRIFGRTFDVSGGSVGFLGFPGINPTLDIEAATRVRRVDQDAPLNVNATVSGTLTVPRVDLTTDEVGLVQSDLLSYLLLGRPSAELASGQTSFLNGALGTGLTFVSGAVANQIGSALAEGFGLDYLSISQAGDFGFASGSVTGSPFANTLIEVGQYVGPDAFIVFVFRPLQGQNAGANLIGGARLEWSLSDDFTFEGFIEDRSLRSRTTTFGDLGPQGRILGVFIFREWGR